MPTFELMDDVQGAVIKVIGVGGCGGNAVNHMIEQEVQGVEFVAINTDAQALRNNKARTQLQIGSALTKGLGAGARPSVGQAAAEEDRSRIADMLEGVDMVFITAGMGGGTGTGAAPVVAQIAKEKGILTVAVVTKPFGHEGKRKQFAQDGIEQLAQHVDSLIIVPNDKLMAVLGKNITLLDAFRASNSVLQGAVAGIAEIINVHGLVNPDFADVRTLMSENGMAMMGSHTATGTERAREAAEGAMASPLLEDVDLSGARGVLVNITASADFTLGELDEVMQRVQEMAADDATVIVGHVPDENMGDALRVTIVATGLGLPAGRRQPKLEPVPGINMGMGTGTDGIPVIGDVDYSELEKPAISRINALRSGRRQANETVEAMKQSGMSEEDIPTFLRIQAD
ncbi:MAG: cell division protein FtsZ [Gallionellaceae bacterium]|jgi:cell division protein FtsZ|nr:cell division protein FtsZ [Gallionellaceae bacterium]